MEAEKQEKKRNILKITKQVEEVAKDSYAELENQGKQLKQTKTNMSKISKEITKIDKDLVEIEQNRQPNKGAFNLICCCWNCVRKDKAQKSTKDDKQLAKDTAKDKDELKSEEHLTPERIEKEWCMRYDPEERWIKQVEIGLDRLLLLGEQMKKSFDEQNALAERIYLDVKSNQDRMKSSKQKMKDIQTTKLS